ncbi:MAG: zinc transport system ATP-binding protein [Desulfovibrionales bacterium]|jgi:zinc transport system ATP-binding protein|nr:zinc transport system ATP-binding protein [Desulfovibrionales bacterium]
MVGEAPPVVELSHVGFAYDGEPVLEDVSLRMGKGEFVAVIGPNGGGKTTLLKIVLGLLTPQTGTVKVFGRPPAEVRRRIGYAPQHSEGPSDFPVSVLDVVLMGFLGTGRARFRAGRDEVERAMAALRRVGLDGQAKRRLNALSGGQQQRALIARALVCDPELLVLDEPTASIDPYGAFCFYEFLSELKEHAPILTVSHELSLAASRITSLAFVNRTLLYNAEPRPTEEMLSLAYGLHDASCPVDGFLRAMGRSLGAERRDGEGAP